MTDLIAQPPSPPPAATLSLSQGGSDGSQPTPAAARYLQLRQEAAARLPPWARVATALPLGERFVGVPLVPDPLKSERLGRDLSLRRAVVALRAAHRSRSSQRYY